MLQMKRITSQLLSKLMAINSLILILVIVIASISIKEYACFLVNHNHITGVSLTETLNGFLIKMIFIVFLASITLQFFSFKKMIQPINMLSNAAKSIQKGKIPPRIKHQTHGELGELINHFNEMTVTFSTVYERREEMLKDIAHELRTPLTNINGYLEALHNDVIEGNRELYGSLLEESLRITRIVHLLSELNSWEKDVFFLEKPFKTFDVKDILEESVTAFKLQLNEQFNSINIQIEPAIIVGHKDGLKQVFSNLITNLIDYDIGKKLSICGFSESDYYHIRFSHKGILIDPDRKELIFERFFRLEDSRSTKAEGAGLGLSITKKIIEAHNGKIDLSTDGYNHCFIIKIPINKEVK
ncbi:hypothetical protein J6TS2_14140 [Heyndrickxia sporothermodurans]|nr:hypothetical protein J6TS2_14140 [Heyndrickxia sporothermodurans]